MLREALLVVVLCVLGPALSCKYWCKIPDSTSYKCCDDNHPYYTNKVPPNHDPHDGRCPEEEEQVCKSSGIFLAIKKAKVAKTSGTVQLVSGEGKQQPNCASDGYCSQEQKCCPSKCARKHICMLSLNKTGNHEDED
ncbi:uncharacterized protein [Cherax quadricarinatus]|uniref:uncharacterized protein isoform X2 n=1 Tax=Cherax quadricarinatus TaxID=27406 RepID=UPI00237909E8|nr:uncharacterized protein LOC128691089 isoform X2 [Cherax quadricarinatus]